MDLRITANNMKTCENASFKAKNITISPQVKEKAGELVSKAGAAAVTAIAAAAIINKSAKKEDVLFAPSPENLVKDIKEPIYIDDKLIFDSKTPDKIYNFDYLKQKFEKSGVMAFLNINNSEVKGAEKFELDYDKYKNRIIMSFELPQKEKAVKYTMILNDKSEVQEMRKQTRLDLKSKYGFKEELIKSEIFSKTKSDKIEYYSRDREIGTEFRKDNETEPRKYINYNADLNKSFVEPYLGKTDDESMIEYFTKYVNGEID